MRTSSFDFIGRTRLWAIISATLMLASLLALLFLRLNLSIDFVGGTSFVLDGVNESVTSGQLQDAAESAGGEDVRAQIVSGDQGNGAIVRMAAVEPFLRDHPDAMHPVTRQIIAGADRLSAADAFRGIYRLAWADAGDSAPELMLGEAGTPIPRLSENWYCCAEPTCEQLAPFQSQPVAADGMP